MLISLIIIVKDDPQVRETLSHLEKIQYTKKEIIVVDNSKGKLDAIRNEFPMVIWIDFKNKSKKKITIPEQRNLGIKNAKGDIIIFIDASCIPQPHWFENLIKPILSGKESVVCGKVTSSKKTHHDLDMKAREHVKYLRECPTINIAIKRDVITTVGIFDERFAYGSDVDYSWRIIDKGFKIFYQSEAIISHDWGTVREEIKRSYWYGRARIMLYKKHVERRKDIIKNDPYIVVYPLFLIGLPLTILFPWYPILLIILLIKNMNAHPLQTVASHLVYGAGCLTELFVIL